jgi:5-methylcytosine-specific restriction enzyme A
MTKKRQFCPRGHDAFKTGRDASKRCLQCKVEDAAARAALQEQEIAERHAAFERQQEEGDRRLEQEYRRAIAAGGDVAAEARWQRLYVQTLDATGSRYGVCQWALDDGNPGACTRRTADVYCGVHNRQSERESARDRGEREAAEQPHDPPSKPPRSRAPRPRRPRKPESRWGQYKRDYPERARLYKSAAWTSARDRQLREHPNCAACGAKASVADHVLNRARGGADLDPRNLQSLCRRCHHAKTIQESHRGMKRAAERRNR